MDIQTGSIETSIFFHCKPAEVYDLIMNAEKHSAITESDVKMANKVDGKFEVFGGYCHGYNIELVKDSKIVQAWHFDEDDWPRLHYSICTFEFEDLNGGCRMHFVQTEIPEKSVEALRKGWHQYYWDPMKLYLEK